MPRVTVHPEAENEIDQAFEWYWAQSRDAAADFLDELAIVQARIRRSPRQFPSVSSSLRKATLHRYPYYLLFREVDEEVQILVVAHAKRRPGYWKKRL
ncbi:type II toxin-antitoxin system RelE/ParE family toxin [Acidicapsa dinghuensis]|uniref:Type II toxin-antitoxin system RelE/ParE family toxin n=1 Tax=Acidicapsa dinghuensis TaxID=2218256 RepID=A0ABW1EJN1_9BACT|nr:type II toxin-antitoxin system RelE/ParE family toxin [Acidicapsa dinghuensis]